MNSTWMTISPTLKTSSSAAKLPVLSHRSSSVPTPNYSRFSVSCTVNTYKTENEGKAANFYKLLSLSPESNTSMDDIKRAYRSMALRYHPDVAVRSCEHHRGGDFSMEDITQLFVQLNEAYETLSDPVLREEYDYQLGLSAANSSCGNISSCESTTYKFQKDLNNVRPNSNWRHQILELKRRSTGRMAQKEGSWASRVRRTTCA